MHGRESERRRSQALGHSWALTRSGLEIPEIAAVIEAVAGVGKGGFVATFRGVHLGATAVVGGSTIEAPQRGKKALRDHAADKPHRKARQQARAEAHGPGAHRSFEDARLPHF